MRFVKRLCWLAIGAILAANVYAHSEELDLWTASRPDGHAPAGVMGDHTHHQGEWMFAYRYMSMSMEGNRDHSTRLSLGDVHGRGYMVAPIRMDMQMHMLGAMYAINDDLTLAMMLPYIEKDGRQHLITGRQFSTHTEGAGDLKLSGLFVVSRWDGQQLHLNLGFSAPTGSIEEQDDTPMALNAKLPYPMQLGSGTWDLLPGVTYLGQHEAWSWGAQLAGTLRLGRNSEGYSLGDRTSVTAWGAKAWTDWLSTSVRLHGQHWGNIDGSDDDLNPAMVPAADPDLKAGERIDALVGVNVYLRSGPLKNHRVALEVGRPVYQRLTGPQLEVEWLTSMTWQLAF